MPHSNCTLQIQKQAQMQNSIVLLISTCNSSLRFTFESQESVVVADDLHISVANLCCNPSLKIQTQVDVMVELLPKLGPERWQKWESRPWSLDNSRCKRMQSIEWVSIRHISPYIRYIRLIGDLGSFHQNKFSATTANSSTQSAGPRKLARTLLTCVAESCPGSYDIWMHWILHWNCSMVSRSLNCIYAFSWSKVGPSYEISCPE